MNQQQVDAINESVDKHCKDNGVIIKTKYEQLSNFHDIIKSAIKDMNNLNLSLKNNN